MFRLPGVSAGLLAGLSMCSHGAVVSGASTDGHVAPPQAVEAPAGTRREVPSVASALDGVAACSEGQAQPCALVPEGCPTGTRTCQGGRWAECVFDAPGAPPACTIHCAGGELVGERLFTAVNRFDALRADWAPSDLVGVPQPYRTVDPLEKMRMQALGHMVQMLQAQRRESTPKIYCGSPYRSFGEQCRLFEQYAAQDHCTKANTYSAMAGHSEHQLGTVCDMVYANNELIRGATPGDAWLAAHAYEYGFVQSYPEGTSLVTGYEAEPWHYRYIGKKAALLHHKMQETAARTISTHELIATVACWPALRIDELAHEDVEDAETARKAICKENKAACDRGVDSPR
jgi:zinc D-Ala-D-Ala carboxypeptidase